MLIEVKASVLTVQSKYGFAPDKLRSELELKAIHGEGRKRKGVAQLLHNLHRFLGGEKIVGVNRHQIRTIYPVLAFLDHGFVAPYLNQVYNEHFGNHQLRLQYGKRVTPLFSLTIDDLENTLPFTHGCALAAILESFYRANRNMYGELSLSSVPALSRVTPGKDVVRERFRQFDLDLHDGLFRS